MNIIAKISKEIDTINQQLIKLLNKQNYIVLKTSRVKNSLNIKNLTYNLFKYNSMIFF